jgi:hypothetical protein
MCIIYAQYCGISHHKIVAPLYMLLYDAVLQPDANVCVMHACFDAMYRGVAAAGLPLAKHLESLLQPAVDAAVQDVRTQMPSACSAASGAVSDADDPYSSSDDDTTVATATTTATITAAAGTTATATAANGSADSMHVDEGGGTNGLTNGHTADVDASTAAVDGAQQQQEEQKQQAAAALMQKQRKRRAGMRTADAWLLADSVHRYAQAPLLLSIYI